MACNARQVRAFTLTGRFPQMLKAIEELGGGADYDAQRGEALICRAFAHFQLANLFCMPYDASTAESTLGIPYTTEPETTVLPDGIERGTLAHTYEMIDSDIEEALLEAGS